MAALTYDMDAGGLEVAFSGIRNIDGGTAHGVEAVFFSNVAVGPDGTFARGQSGARIQGAFHGAGHADERGLVFGFRESAPIGFALAPKWRDWA